MTDGVNGWDSEQTFRACSNLERETGLEPATLSLEG